VMEAGAKLVEGGVAMFLGGSPDADAGATADTVEKRLGLDQTLHAEEGQQSLVEGQAGVVVGDRDVQVCDASGFTVVSEANTTDPIHFRPLGWEPQVGNALYLGFEPPESVDKKGPFPREMRIRAFLPLGRTTDQYHQCGDADLRPEVPVKLVWEYKDVEPQPQGEELIAEDTRPWRRLVTLVCLAISFARK